MTRARQTYSVKRQRHGAGLGILVCIISMPVAIVLTIALLPFWRGLEKAAAIESVGHSGPAEWCYLFVYTIVLFTAGLIWPKLSKERPQRD